MSNFYTIFEISKTIIYKQVVLSRHFKFSAINDTAQNIRQQALKIVFSESQNVDMAQYTVRSSKRTTVRWVNTAFRV